MWLSDIDLRLLRVFKAVAEAGGFVKAQDKLGINQPAISSHIANLESRLGVRLCERGRSGFGLTPDGRDVLTETIALLGFVDESSVRLNSIGKRTSLLCRVGVIDCILTHPDNPLANCIAATKGANPDARIRIGIYDVIECLSALRSKQIDIGILGLDEFEAVPNDLEITEVFTERSSLYCIPGHPCASGSADKQAALRAARISAHSFISNPVDGELDVLLHGENVDISQGNVESTVYLTLAGTHVGLIPDHFAEIWVRRGALTPIAPDRFRVNSQFYAVRLKNARPPRPLQVLWQALEDVPAGVP